MKKIHNDGKMTHSFIMDLCLEKFPHLRDQLQQLTDEEMKKIY